MLVLESQYLSYTVKSMYIVSCPKWVFLTYVGYSYMHKCLDSDIIIVILLLYAITIDFKLKNPLETDFQIKVFNKSIALTDSEFQQLLTYILRVSKVMIYVSLRTKQRRFGLNKYVSIIRGG